MLEALAERVFVAETALAAQRADSDARLASEKALRVEAELRADSERKWREEWQAAVEAPPRFEGSVKPDQGPPFGAEPADDFRARRQLVWDAKYEELKRGWVQRQVVRDWKLHVVASSRKGRSHATSS